MGRKESNQTNILQIFLFFHSNVCLTAGACTYKYFRFILGIYDEILLSFSSGIYIINHLIERGKLANLEFRMTEIWEFQLKTRMVAYQHNQSHIDDVING